MKKTNKAIDYGKGMKWLLTQLSSHNIVELKTEFEVRDALGGSVSGDYKKDVARLMKNNQICSEALYDEAYQNTMCP